MHDKILWFFFKCVASRYSIQICFNLLFFRRCFRWKAASRISFFYPSQRANCFPSGSIGQKVFGLQSCYMTAGGSLSLIGSSSLRFPGPFRLAFESPRRAEGRKRYKTTAKTTHTMAIIANPLSPVPWPGPGRPSALSIVCLFSVTWWVTLEILCFTDLVLLQNFLLIWQARMTCGVQNLSIFDENTILIRFAHSLVICNYDENSFFEWKGWHF